MKKKILKALKIRQRVLTVLIDLTPTGPEREKLTTENIQILDIIRREKTKYITDRTMYLNMQYYMEYCSQNDYVTPQDWIEKHKHF